MFSGKKEPISSRKWLADMANAFRTSVFLEEAKVRYDSCLFEGHGTGLVGGGMT